MLLKLSYSYFKLLFETKIQNLTLQMLNFKSKLNIFKRENKE